MLRFELKTFSSIVTALALGFHLIGKSLRIEYFIPVEFAKTTNNNIDEQQPFGWQPTTPTKEESPFFQSQIVSSSKSSSTPHDDDDDGDDDVDPSFRDGLQPTKITAVEVGEDEGYDSSTEWLKNVKVGKFILSQIAILFNFVHFIFLVNGERKGYIGADFNALGGWKIHTFGQWFPQVFV